MKNRAMNDNVFLTEQKILVDCKNTDKDFLISEKPLTGRTGFQSFALSSICFCTRSAR